MRGVPYGPPDGGKGHGVEGGCFCVGWPSPGRSLLVSRPIFNFFFTAQNFITNIYYFHEIFPLWLFDLQNTMLTYFVCWGGGRKKRWIKNSTTDPLCNFWPQNVDLLNHQADLLKMDFRQILLGLMGELIYHENKRFQVQGFRNVYFALHIAICSTLQKVAVAQCRLLFLITHCVRFYASKTKAVGMSEWKIFVIR